MLEKKENHKNCATSVDWSSKTTINGWRRKTQKGKIVP